MPTRGAAAKAAPIMNHALEEIAEMMAISQSLVVNIGTLDPSWIKSMKLGLVCALELGKPTVLDPVGVGATVYRTHAAHALIELARISVVRANAPEILALGGSDAKTKGVESQAISSSAQGLTAAI